MQLSNVRFGEGIKAVRLIKKLSQKQLAKKSGVGQATISDIESGTHDTTFGTANKITTALGLRIRISVVS